VPGVNYKNASLFRGPKILIRKTGLGIYAAMDESSSLTNQTVYILTPSKGVSKEALYYYLGMINSRVVYYYYLKMFGENEWKSHPYLTKEVIFSLPVPAWSGDEQDRISAMFAKRLSTDYEKLLDEELENHVMAKYDLSKREQSMVKCQMNALPNLRSVSDMRM